MTRDSRFDSFRAFWPFYLSQHARPATRALHIGGVLLAGLAAAAAVYLRNPLILLIVLLLGYGPAWVAHFFIEKNRPATFTYPAWSLIGDLRMTGLWLGGRLSRELQRVKTDQVGESP